MLKSFICLAIFSVVLASDKVSREKLQEADEKCRREHNVSFRDMDTMYKELPNGTDQIDQKYKCFTKCIMDEINLKDEHGNDDFQQIAEVYFYTENNTEALKVTRDCVAQHDSEIDACEKPFKILSCIAVASKTEEDD